MPEDVNQLTEEEVRIAEARQSLPPPAAALNLNDIEVNYSDWQPGSNFLNMIRMQEFAEKVLTKTAWAYYRSSADDENGAVKLPVHGYSD